MVTKQTKNNSGWLKIAIMVTLIVGIVLVFRYTPISIKSFTPENIKNYIQGFGPLAPIVFMVIYALRAVILVLPVGVMSLAGGLAFGKWLGTLYIIIGATAGSCISFLIARYLGRSTIEKLGVKKHGKLKMFDEGIEKNGLKVMLFMRLIPLFQYDAVNFGAGFSKMKFRDYALGTLIGMIPGGFINALLGSSLDNIVSVQFFAALGVFILLMFIPAIYKQINRKRSGTASEVKTKEKVEEEKHAISIIKNENIEKGECPSCKTPIGPLAVIMAWTRWGRFVCPGCKSWISFKGWFFTVLVLTGAMVGIERFLHLSLKSSLPLWISFTGAFIIALMVMFLVPMIWSYKKVNL